MMMMSPNDCVMLDSFGTLVMTLTRLMNGIVVDLCTGWLAVSEGCGLAMRCIMQMQASSRAQPLY